MAGTCERKGRRREWAPRCEELEGRRLLAVSLSFDYTLDSTGFFTADRRQVLQSTLGDIARQLGDSLAAVPSSSYPLSKATGTWTVTTSVPADVIKVYVYGDSLTGSIAQGGAYYSTAANGTMRGQGQNDYAPDVAYLKFDMATNWFFGQTTAGLGGSQIDFVTVARHEFLHSLGFLSSQPTFARFVQGDSFTGPYAKAANGGSAVPVDGSHVDASLPSIMNPVTTAGRRTELTALEYGFLRDFGWSVVTTPSTFYRGVDLFTGGQGDGTADVKVVPSRGVYMMQIDAMAGDTMRLRTYDGSTAAEQGVDSFLRVFNAAGAEVFSNNDTAGGGKEDVTYTFPTGGTYWVGAGTFGQRNYTYSSPPTLPAASTAFRLQATLTGKADDEPHNIASASTAVPLASGGYSKNTTLEGNAADVYRIDGRLGSVYAVSTALPAGGGLLGPALVAVYDAQGRRVAASSGPGPFGSLSFTATATAPYYVRVARVAGPATVGLSESTADPGFNVVGTNGESSAQGTRSRGSDYALSVVVTLAPPANLNPLFVDYGSFGLWRWSEAGGWAQINAADPEDLAVGADGALYVDYGSFGLWRWSEAGGWAQVNAANSSRIAAASDGALFIDYGSFGLWRWTAAAGIQKLSDAASEALAPGPSGEVYIDYGAGGLWRWTPAAGLKKLNDANPQGIAAGPAGTLYVDFGSFGLWSWTEAGGIVQMNSADPQNLAAGRGGALYIDFGTAGLWSLSGGSYQLLSSADADGLAASADGWLYVDFGPQGIFRWASVGGFELLNPGDPQRIAVLPTFGRA